MRWRRRAPLAACCGRCPRNGLRCGSKLKLQNILGGFVAIQKRFYIGRFLTVQFFNFYSMNPTHVRFFVRATGRARVLRALVAPPGDAHGESISLPCFPLTFGCFSCRREGFLGGFSARGDKILLRVFFRLFFFSRPRGSAPVVSRVGSLPKRLIVGLAISIAVIFACVSCLHCTATAGDRFIVGCVPDPSVGRAKQAKPFPFFALCHVRFFNVICFVIFNGESPYSAG